MLAQKLDFLMKVTNTTNSTLGRALAFDASYIGRIRTGKRGLPKKQPFIKPAAAFFARSIRETYQQTAVAEAICPGRLWPEDKAEIENLLIAWLSREEHFDAASANQFLTNSPTLSINNTSVSSELKPQITYTNNEPVSLYYGNAGKRNAVDKFLSDLCALKSPQTLFLYSDEDFGWLYEEDHFSKRWAALLIEFIANGGQIKIIHTINRGSNDMLEAVQKWLPLYMTGAIRPYFYPKIRDGVYRRTLFIAQDHSAIISTSIGNHTQDALNILLYDKRAVQALEKEFQDYFSLCKPLLEVFTLQNSELFWQMLTDLEASESHLITAQAVPYYFTMPEDLVSSMASRIGSKWMLKKYKEATTYFHRLLAHHYSVTEILNLPSPEVVKAGKVHFPMCDLFGHPDLYYTASEFKAHLEGVLQLLHTTENYQVVLSTHTQTNINLFVKEDLGAIILRAEPPTTAFGISEQRLTSALWELLHRLAETDSNKEKTIELLENYLLDLQ